MNLLFFCPRWGCECQPWNEFFLKVREAGYDGVELGFAPTLSADEKAEITSGLKQHDLAVIGQHWQTIESNFNEHRQTFKEHLYSLTALSPLFINSQTVKIIFR